LRQIIEQSELKDEVKDRELDRVEENAKKYLEENRENFEKTLKKGEEAGINWKKATFVDVEYGTSKRDGIERANVYVIFEYKDSKYKVEVDDCLKAERGWVATDGLRWQG
jgi:hypothetical protein